MTNDDDSILFTKDDRRVRELYAMLSYTVEGAQFLPTIRTEYGHKLVADLGNLRLWVHINELNDLELKWQMRINDPKNGVDNVWSSLY